MWLHKSSLKCGDNFPRILQLKWAELMTLNCLRETQYNDWKLCCMIFCHHYNTIAFSKCLQCLQLRPESVVESLLHVFLWFQIHMQFISWFIVDQCWIKMNVVFILLFAFYQDGTLVWSLVWIPIFNTIECQKCLWTRWLFTIWTLRVSVRLQCWRDFYANQLIVMLVDSHSLTLMLSSS